MYFDIIFYKIGKIQKLKVKKISEKENDTKKELSQGIKITDKETKRNYYISLITVIITSLIFAFVWYLLRSQYYYMILFGIPIGILIEFYGLYEIIMYRFKPEKTISKEDKDLKRNYYISLLMVIFTPIIAILAFLYYFIGISVRLVRGPFLLGLIVIIPLGIIIGLYGLYGIMIYNLKPEKYRELLEKKRSNKFLVMVIVMPIVIFLFLSPFSLSIFGYLTLFIMIPIGNIIPIGSIIIIGTYGLYLKRMTGETNRNKGIIEIVNGIIILIIGLYWIYYFIMIMIETSWRGTGWGIEYGYLILGIIFSLIGLVIICFGIIDYKKKGNY